VDHGLDAYGDMDVFKEMYLGRGPRALTSLEIRASSMAGAEVSGRRRPSARNIVRNTVWSVPKAIDQQFMTLTLSDASNIIPDIVDQEDWFLRNYMMHKLNERALTTCSGLRPKTAPVLSKLDILPMPSKVGVWGRGVGQLFLSYDYVEVQ
jgi:hypothetical protein